MLKKIISLIAVFILSFNVVNASELDLKSEKYILYNLNDNNVIFEKDSHVEANIASLTKIMTTIVAIENYNEDYNKKITITSEMLNGIDWDVTVVGFKVGDKVTFDDLLYGTIICSGADAVNALAITTSGSISNFVKLMNNKVKELDLKNTKFANPVGLYNKNNYSSAYDMAEILKYALKNEKFKRVFTTKEYTFTTGKEAKSTIAYYNKKLNGDISYITGAKTGYIRAAGYCLATTATINNINYLLVTLNAYNDSSAHIKDTITIYKYFSDNYGYHNIVSNDDIVLTLKTKFAKEKTIDIHANNEKELYLKNDFDKKDLDYIYTGIDEISYFTNKNTKLGNIKIMYQNEELYNFDLTNNETLSFSLFGFLWYYKMYILIVVFILFVFVKLSKKRSKRRVK